MPKFRKINNSNWYVITGGPSSGKTTVLKELAKLGYVVYPEAARVFIDKEMKKGKSLKEIRGNEAEFQRKVLKIKVEVEKTAPKDKIVFFDRAIPDSIAYYQIAGLNPQEVLRFCPKRKYKKIFFLEQLPFGQDYARIEDNKTIKKLNKLLKESYKNLGYEVITIPALSVKERVEKILSEIKKNKIMNYKKFIEKKIKDIKKVVGSEKAISVLSGGVDSSTVTVLGYRALGNKLKVIFINNGLMRENEPENVVKIFKKLGIKVKIIDAKKKFFRALRGKTDSEEKRKAITQVFYGDVFKGIVKKNKIKFLLQGTILTDIEETVAGIKRQHNVLAQIGISSEKEYGYKVIEPLVELRKADVRKVAKLLELPEEIHQRIPFPGPALAARVIGEVNPERIALIRKTTTIVEKELKNSGAFQYFPVLMEDKATGIRNKKREFGNIIIIRCVESVDARKATPTKLSWKILEMITKRLTTEIPGVNRVCYDITPKPPATIEYI